jgi:hypothetical protein
MAQTFYIFRSDGTLAFTIDEGTVVDLHGLRFDGFQKPSYGDRRNNNLLHLLENFASEEDASNPGNPPTDVIDTPLTGQMWYDKTAGSTKLYNGAAWVVISADVFTDAGPFAVLDGTASNQLTLVRNDLATIIINNIASKNDLDAHIADTIDAHNAADIFFDDTVVGFTANDVQEAINDVQISLNSHLTDTTDAHDASAISFVPYGSFGSTNVQGALQEAEDELDTSSANAATLSNTVSNHIADTVDAHDASAISFVDSGVSFVANDVQEALEDLNNIVNAASTQSVVDSLRVTLSFAQGLSAGVPAKVQFNSKQFGDDENQFNTINNRFIAKFDQIVRVRAYVGVTTINDESYLQLMIRKNGVDERLVQEWKWPENSDPPGDIECSCLIDLVLNDYIEVWVNRVGGGGGININNSTARTALEIDVIKEL